MFTWLSTSIPSIRMLKCSSCLYNSTPLTPFPTILCWSWFPCQPEAVVQCFCRLCIIRLGLSSRMCDSESPLHSLLLCFIACHSGCLCLQLVSVKVIIMSTHISLHLCRHRSRYAGLWRKRMKSFTAPYLRTRTRARALDETGASCHTAFTSTGLDANIF